MAHLGPSPQTENIDKTLQPRFPFACQCISEIQVLEHFKMDISIIIDTLLFLGTNAMKALCGC